MANEKIKMEMAMEMVERLHLTGLRACRFVNNLSPVVSVMCRTKAFIDSVILSSTYRYFS